ncbi:hypothetical protein VTO42DRAFT_2043 [Malbranchea cinnamomea]
MNKRQKSIDKAIVVAIDREDVPVLSCFARFCAFWHIFHICLVRYGTELLGELRENIWKIDLEEYRESFHGEDQTALLKPIGDLGYSGSTFFITPDTKYLVKSLPRRFEYKFFERDMFRQYYEHMVAHPTSFLVHITDYLTPAYHTVGSVANIIPTHHIVMENILYGKTAQTKEDEWETYDLKPSEYFFPQRDMLPKQMTSPGTMKRVINVFDDKVRLTQRQFSELRTMLATDTAFLRRANVVDYSLFLVRFPARVNPARPDDRALSSTLQRRDSACEADARAGKDESWRRGVKSADGKWTYRAVLLDFMWSKHQLRAQATTGAVMLFNLLARKGDMSITTTPEDYRKTFLEMVENIVEVCE